jgi:hypothetical protein
MTAFAWLVRLLDRIVFVQPVLQTVTSPKG